MNGQDERIRAGHVDREDVVGRLNEAFGEGRLDLVELEDRVGAAYAARYLSDLSPLTADLPPRPSGVSAAPTARSVRPRTGVAVGPLGVAELDRDDDRLRFAAWLSVSLICLTVWVVTVVASGHWNYPWWIWVAGPWGVSILARVVSHRMGR